MVNKKTSFWLCLFLGWLGVHRFYERKTATGILYMCTFGLFCIGWIFDLWILFITPNKPITESYQYNTYLKVVEALQKSGYSVDEYEREWCHIGTSILHDSAYCGNIHVVADPSPDLVSRIIGSFFSGYEKERYFTTDYATWKRITKTYRNSFERNGHDFNSYHYWPDGSLIGGFAGTNEPSKDNKWLSILKSVIG